MKLNELAEYISKIEGLAFLVKNEDLTLADEASVTTSLDGKNHLSSSCMNKHRVNVILEKVPYLTVPPYQNKEKTKLYDLDLCEACLSEGLGRGELKAKKYKTYLKIYRFEKEKEQFSSLAAKTHLAFRSALDSASGVQKLAGRLSRESRAEVLSAKDKEKTDYVELVKPNIVSEAEKFSFKIKTLEEEVNSAEYLSWIISTDLVSGRNRSNKSITVNTRYLELLETAFGEKLSKQVNISILAEHCIKIWRENKSQGLRLSGCKALLVSIFSQCQPDLREAGDRAVAELLDTLEEDWREAYADLLAEPLQAAVAYGNSFYYNPFDEKGTKVNIMVKKYRLPVATKSTQVKPILLKAPAHIITALAEKSGLQVDIIPDKYLLDEAIFETAAGIWQNNAMGKLKLTEALDAAYVILHK